MNNLFCPLLVGQRTRVRPVANSQFDPNHSWSPIFSGLPKLRHQSHARYRLLVEVCWPCRCLVLPIAKKYNVTNAAIALAFTLRLPGMVSIPKSSHETRVLENAAAAGLVLDEDDLAKLDQDFPPPRRKHSPAIT